MKGIRQARLFVAPACETQNTQMTLDFNVKDFSGVDKTSQVCSLFAAEKEWNARLHRSEI